jgi:hypothetical protein
MAVSTFCLAAPKRITGDSIEYRRPMGLATKGNLLALATEHAIWEFSDIGGKDQCVYIPRRQHHTGVINTHDLQYSENDLLLLNTRFNTLCKGAPTGVDRQVLPVSFPLRPCLE